MKQSVQPAVLSQNKAQDFMLRMGETIDSGAVALMVSVGHRTGLFDSMDGMPFASSQQIAQQANLAERYVREWLAVMVVAQVVDYDAVTET